MPKQVDHARRREEIASALWRLVQREGMQAVSVRNVAREAGWSTGSLRHYFRTRDELLQFAMQSMIDHVSDRVRTHWRATVNDPDVVESSARALEEGLPIDEIRSAEVQVWRAFHEAARTDPTLQETLRDDRRMARYLMRLVVCRIGSLPAPAGPDEPVRDDVETEAIMLHAFWDGLTYLSSSLPSEYDAALMRRTLRRYLSDLHDQLRRIGPA
jgi:AcrR family transcriptional regulator